MNESAYTSALMFARDSNAPAFLPAFHEQRLPVGIPEQVVNQYI